jgi:hypothetical protein
MKVEAVFSLVEDSKLEKKQPSPVYKNGGFLHIFG